MNYTIYRGSWRRGGDTQQLSSELGDTSLYHARTRMMCCLGQCAFEAGVPLENLRDVGEPVYIDFPVKMKLVDAGLLNDDEDFGRQSRFSKEAIGINDDATITDQAREKLLKELAESSGHTVTFVDGTAPWFKESTHA